MKLYKVIIWVVLLVLIAYIIGNKTNTRIVYERVEKEIILDNLTEKVNELKGELVSELKSCESGGFSENYGLITFDPHPTKKKVQIESIGSFQFKKSTIQHYYKTFYNKDITGKEAILIALDDQKAGDLATKIIFETENGLGNWYNCSKKHNLKGKLELIIRLNK